MSFAALTDMKEYMGMLSAGDYSNEVPHAERKDEIGEMAQSVAYFREGAMDTQVQLAASPRSSRLKSSVWKKRPQNARPPRMPNASG
jgi:signal transduction histidine kinase